jgi:alpha-1,2-mannosyltransferase
MRAPSWLWWFLAAACVYLATAAYVEINGDVLTTNLASWQLATNGRPYLDQFTYAPLDDHPGRAIWVVLDADGREIIGRSAGPMMLAVPAYWLWAQLGGGDTFTLVPAAVTAALVTGLAVALFHATVRTRLPAREASLATFVVAFATPVWSVAANGVWPHTVTVVAIAAMGWACARERWWLVGVLAGIAVLGRAQTAIIAAVLGITLAVWRRDWRLAVKIAVPSLGLLGVDLLWTRWMYGVWNPVGYYNPEDVAKWRPDGLFDPVNLLGLFVSPDRGILVWTPVILLLLPALVRSWRTLPDWSRALAAAGLVFVVAESTQVIFPGGDSVYGYRMALELLLCSAPALAFSAPRTGRVARWLLSPVLVVQTLAIAVGAVNNGLGLPLARVWTHNSFVEAVSVSPTVAVAAVVVAVLLSVLVRRIWLDPGLRPRHGARTPGS